MLNTRYIGFGVDCKGFAMAQWQKQIPGGTVIKGQTTARTKYRGLSTAQQTMKLSVASVEMTWVSEG
jgi:hypothetical protein